MSVAAGIEIVPGGRQEPDQSQVPAGAPGQAQSAGWAGAAAASSSSSSVPGTESFRSSWQSLLTSLGAGINGSGEGLPAESAGSALASTAHFAGGSTPRSGQGRAQQGTPAGGATVLSLASSRAGVPVWRAALGAPWQSAANPATKSPASTPPAESANGAHSVNSGKSAKPEAAWGGTATALVSATAGSLPPAMPIPVSESPVAKLTEAPLSDLSTESPAAFTPGFFNSHSSHPDSSHLGGPGAVASLIGASGSRAADGVGTPELPGKASPVPATDPLAAGRGRAPDEELDGIEGSASGGTETLTAGEGAAPSGRMRPQVENTLQTLTESQTQAQPGGQGVEAVAAPMGNDGLDRGSTAGNAAASQSGQSPVMPPIGGKPGLANGMRTSEQAGAWLARAAVHEPPLLEGQLGLAAQDGFNAALARDPAGMRGSMDTTAGMGGESTGSAASHDAPATRETFAALDDATASGTPTWVHAGAQRVEAGFQDPTLGWVGVRADASGGGVHALLVPGSAEAALALGGHLAGLNAYLAEQHTPVESLTLAAPEGRWAGSGMDQDASRSMDQGAGQDTGQGASSGRQSSPRTSAPALTAVSWNQPALTGRADRTVQPATPGGVHISVMA